MSLNDHNRNGKGGLPIEIEDSTEHVTEELPQGHSLMPEPIPSEPKGGEVETPATSFATRDGNKASEGLGKKKLVLLGCGLLLAIMFFVFTALVGKHPKIVAKPQSPQPAQSQTTNKPKGSVTPLMDAVHQASSDDSSGQLSPGDINRNRSTDGRMQTPKTNVAPKSTMQQTPLSTSLGNVPSFSDTQQKWEEPRPYGEASASPVQTQQQQNSLKEPSLVFVRSQTQPPLSTSTKASEVGEEAPFLDVTPGSRIMAKLEAQISSADPTDVVAVVEYTYAIGDQVVVPAGARVLGKIQQVDRNGYTINRAQEPSTASVAAMSAPKKMTQSMSWVMLVFNVPFRGRENIWILASLCDWGFPPSIHPVRSRAMMASDSPLCVRAITRLCDPFCVWVIFVLIAPLRVRGVIATYDPLFIRGQRHLERIIPFRI